MNVGQVLIVSSAEKGTEFFKKYLDGLSVDVAAVCSEARRRLGEKDYDAVVINCPMKDEFGTELAEEVVKNTYAGVMVLTKSEVYDEVAYGMERMGVLCLPKPVSAHAFRHGMALISASSERMKRLAAKTENLKEKMEEIKLVGRAKLILVTKLALSEEEAHRYIEKQAMDRCVKRTVIAMEIIKTYQN